MFRSRVLATGALRQKLGRPCCNVDVGGRPLTLMLVEVKNLTECRRNHRHSIRSVANRVRVRVVKRPPDLDLRNRKPWPQYSAGEMRFEFTLYVPSGLGMGRVERLLRLNLMRAEGNEDLVVDRQPFIRSGPGIGFRVIR